jgi:quinol monooxygenase YgiN
MGICVICTYRAKPGKEKDLEALMAQHVPTLRAENLATGREVMSMVAKDGTYVEIFEWASEEAARAAEANAKVQEIWKSMAQICDFVPLNSVADTDTPFAHFTPMP